jgi:acyl-CoA thioesterase-1
MRRVCSPAVLVLAAIATAHCGGVGPTEPTTKPGIIVAFGDSLTSGPGLKPSETYPALLEKRLRQEGYNYRVINAGVTGDTSSEAFARLDSALAPDAKVLIVALGINDGLRGMPTQTLEQNLSTIIERAQAQGMAVVLCGMESPPVRGFGYSIEFHRVFTRVADRYNVPLVPFFLLSIVANPDLNMPDGVHPNAEGHRRIAEAIWPYLERVI